MSVTDVIAEIERLPVADLAKVQSAVTNRYSRLEGLREAAAEPRTEVRHATDAEFAAASDHVFTQHNELLRRLAQ